MKYIYQITWHRFFGMARIYRGIAPRPDEAEALAKLTARADGYRPRKLWEVWRVFEHSGLVAH